MLILKDFTIVLDRLLDAQGVDIKSMTAHFRRHLEEVCMGSSASDWDESSNSGDPIVIEGTLHRIVDAVNDSVYTEHGISVKKRRKGLRVASRPSRSTVRSVRAMQFFADGRDQCCKE